MSHGFITLIAREAVGDRDPRPHEANLYDMSAKYADVVSEAKVAGYFRANAHWRDRERGARLTGARQVEEEGHEDDNLFWRASRSRRRRWPRPRLGGWRGRRKGVGREIFQVAGLRPAGASL